jgi:hypothetical protein
MATRSVMCQFSTFNTPLPTHAILTSPFTPHSLPAHKSPTMASCPLTRRPLSRLHSGMQCDATSASSFASCALFFFSFFFSVCSVTATLLSQVCGDHLLCANMRCSKTATTSQLPVSPPKPCSRCHHCRIHLIMLPLLPPSLHHPSLPPHLSLRRPHTTGWMWVGMWVCAGAYLLSLPLPLPGTQHDIAGTPSARRHDTTQCPFLACILGCNVMLPLPRPQPCACVGACGVWVLGALT